jgi:hypothetical protein
MCSRRRDRPGAIRLILLSARAQAGASVYGYALTCYIPSLIAEQKFGHVCNIVWSSEAPHWNFSPLLFRPYAARLSERRHSWTQHNTGRNRIDSHVVWAKFAC